MTVDVPPPAGGSPSCRFPFWLYPNLLALDAPIVAVVWQGFVADVFGVPTPFAARTGLFSAVWLVYLLDRKLDAHKPHSHVADRHLYATRHPRVIFALSGFAFAGSVFSAVALPLEYLLTGGGVAVLVGCYLVAVHLLPNGWMKHGAKELLVGVVFALGVGLPSLIAPQYLLPRSSALVAFGLLCWWNCRLIDRWEQKPHASRIVGRLIGISSVVCSGFSPWSILVVVSLAALLLFFIDVSVPRIGVRAARVLADVVLLTPLLLWPFA